MGFPSQWDIQARCQYLMECSLCCSLSRLGNILNLSMLERKRKHPMLAGWTILWHCCHADSVAVVLTFRNGTKIDCRGERTITDRVILLYRAALPWFLISHSDSTPARQGFQQSHSSLHPSVLTKFAIKIGKQMVLLYCQARCNGCNALVAA